MPPRSRRVAREERQMAAIRRYLADPVYRARVNRARSFPEGPKAGRRKKGRNGRHVDGADLIPLNFKHRRMTDAEFEALLRKADDPDTQRRMDRMLQGRTAVEYVKDLREALAARGEPRGKR